MPTLFIFIFGAKFVVDFFFPLFSSRARTFGMGEGGTGDTDSI